MSVQKPSIPKGTRDFSPEETGKRNYIFDTIKSVFQKYGYLPIETPAMENLSTLLGKYGEEGDKLLFKILNSGDFLKNIEQEEISGDANKVSLKISEKGLRYDLTVPFARYVVQNRNAITFPFKRYQIQPVWRADRPQKGRYREFYQCDADVIGSGSLLNEVELLQIIDEVFGRLTINATIKINNRKILTGIAEYIGYPEKITDITVAIDKLDKAGLENVVAELKEKGISGQAIEDLKSHLFVQANDNKSRLKLLKSWLLDSQTGKQGIEEIELLLTYIEKLNIKSKIELDLTLARGLNYYTGAIIEVKANDVQIGSICGGGRYDNLTGIFGLPGVSGVGISFGADRIYDVMGQLDLFPSEVKGTTKILFVNFGENEAIHCLKLIKKIRESDISAELYPDTAKMKKQMDFANKKNIPFVALVGESEMNENIITLKDMSSGEQVKLSPDQLIEKLKN